ncbi:MASE1 domain-containing protein [Burkholderia pseudomallei]|uniref:MASE1 domain-containing protein n=1 Tax=Burkholderia pseudomallei TaxID=28450 RepID=UPI001AD6BAD8|nr:MASE1 domain-containing protein [Burkholderia pseudomallei]MBO7795483.1 MASE1 domain-containing protein [Burkholderia pseudomallei]MBO7814036.1 MASE1 domain-containing protein [Burkholderia pseudomallei]
MLKRFLARPWLRHVAVAVFYAFGYALFRAMSFSHWSVFAGFQLAALLFVPYRYWPALVIGELPALWVVAFSCAGQFGWTWAAFKMFPAIVLLMPIVFVCRERLRLFGKRTGAINMTAFVFCAWLAALVVALNNTLLLSLAPRPPGFPSLSTWMLWYGLGHYVGILTVTPLALGLREALSRQSLRVLKVRIAESRLLMDSIGMLFPSLGLLVWVGWRASPDSDVRHIAQVAMFLPMVVLALRHGWQGAAVGGSAASVAVIMLMPARYDHDTVQAQAFIAFAITTMLMMGTRVTAWNRREQQERHDVRLALALAQRNYFAGERQLRLAARAMLDVQAIGYRLLRRLEQLSPVEFEIQDRRSRSQTERAARLIEHFQPLSGPDRMLPQALMKGALAQTLEHHGVPLRVRYYGGVSGLSHDLHVAFYRLICDSITHLCECHYFAEVVVCLRCRQQNGRRRIMMRIGGKVDSGEQRSLTRDELLWQLRLLSRGEGFQPIRDGAATFGGTARQRVRGEWLHIIAFMQEPM